MAESSYMQDRWQAKLRRANRNLREYRGRSNRCRIFVAQREKRGFVAQQGRKAPGNSVAQRGQVGRPRLHDSPASRYRAYRARNPERVRQAARERMRRHRARRHS